MNVQALAGVAMGLSVVGAATVALWLDRRGRESVIRTGCVAMLAASVVLLVGQSRAKDLIWSFSWDEAVSAGMAAVWLAGLAAALGLAVLLGWIEAPVEGVVLGAVAGAAAGAGLGVAAGEPESFALAPLRVGWLMAAGALVGGGVSLAGLQRFVAARIGGGTGALMAGWGVCGGLLLGQREAGDGLAEHPLLAGAAGLLAIATTAAFAALAHRIEAGILLRELSEEAKFGIIPIAVAQAVARFPSRLRAGWWPRADERRWLSVTLTELALRKHRLRRGSSAAAGLDGLQVGRIRTRLRTSLASGGAGGEEGG